jgi:hypothetical protein
MEPRYGSPDQAGAAETRRVARIIRLKGGLQPGLDFKVWTGSCVNCERENLAITD